MGRWQRTLENKKLDSAFENEIIVELFQLLRAAQNPAQIKICQQILLLTTGLGRRGIEFLANRRLLVTAFDVCVLGPRLSRNVRK